MNAPPRLSLLIPAYNAASILPRLLASAAGQSRPFDEIWVYDDCSQDDTAEVAERLGAKVVRGETNRGCSYGKSELIDRTTCDWLHFHDADDLLLPNFVEAAHGWMSRPDVDVVAFGCDEQWEDSRETVSLAIPNDSKLSADAVRETIVYKINSTSGLYRRQALLDVGGFDLDPEVLYNEDQAFHSKLARGGLRFRGDPTIAVVYLRQTASMSNSNRSKCLRARYHVLLKVVAADRERCKAELAQQLWDVAAHAAAHSDWNTADKAATTAARLSAPLAASGSRLFRALCYVSPTLALRTREAFIRTLRPHLRLGFTA